MFFFTKPIGQSTHLGVILTNCWPIEIIEIHLPSLTTHVNGGTNRFGVGLLKSNDVRGMKIPPDASTLFQLCLFFCGLKNKVESSVSKLKPFKSTYTRTRMHCESANDWINLIWFLWSLDSYLVDRSNLKGMMSFKEVFQLIASCGLVIPM